MNTTVNQSTDRTSIRAFGTREWAVKNFNIFKGCVHHCKYCYAKAISVWHGTGKQEDWINEQLREKEYKTINRKQYDGPVMFPSTHDITPSNLVFYTNKLRKILAVGNEVLVVSKPHLECIKSICEQFTDYKDKILFRFTIGSNNSETLRFWEINAPSFEERFESLQYAFNAGYRTSVSSEPVLDGNTVGLIEILLPYVTNSIWLGKANKLKLNLSLNGFKDEETTRKAEELIALISDEYVYGLYNLYKDNPKIKWKDSFKEVLGIPLQEEAGLNI